MIHRVGRVIPAALWMLFIFVMSSQERFPTTPGVSVFFMSIVAHLVLYGLLGLFLLLAIHDTGRPSTRSVTFAILGAAMYGVSDEFHQSFVQGRNASLFDLVVNSIGATLAVTGWSYRRTIRILVPSR